MYLKYLQIRNYKNMASAIFEFSKGANTIIGENDAGKSNAMTALRILLDSNFIYNSKQLKESDFSGILSNWRGHWIIISAVFEEISQEDQKNDILQEISLEDENVGFLRAGIRCADQNRGVVTLFIRPKKHIRKKLSKAASREEFDLVRNGIKLTDYEFHYTSRAQTDFTDPVAYASLVGDIENGHYVDPDDMDTALVGVPVEILDVWEHISFTFVDALRDVSTELHRPRNPIKRIFDVVQGELTETSIADIKNRIHQLNETISGSEQVSGIGEKLNSKLQDIVGLVYSPEIMVESKLREDIASISRYLSVSPRDLDDIELLGLGHLNILYIALKLVEFEYNRSHEILNIMVIEEPEAHIHPHIQKALFDNLNVSGDYTQVIMTTHATHLSEVSSIDRLNIIKPNHGVSIVMRPTNGLDEFGKGILKLKDFPISACLERYLDARRSVLLFSKGVVLVEGDGEEILIPALVRNALGISLDEVGIGLINVGSVAFENIACLFDPKRVQRYCAIVTDFDAVVKDADKSKPEAAKRGESRKKKFNDLFGTNPWVGAFYAPHTLEVDFADVERNREYIKPVIESHYSQKETIETHQKNLDTSESARYDTVLTLAGSMGKGWYATMLASKLDHEVIIPDYLIGALAFASREVVTYSILRKMAINILGKYAADEKTEALKHTFIRAATAEDIENAIGSFCDLLPDSSYSGFVRHRKDLGLHG